MEIAEQTHPVPEAVKSAARAGLALRAKHGRGGIGPGQARARQLISGQPMKHATVMRMHSYFSRHAVDKKGADWNNTEKPSNGRIAWALWGGDAGARWAHGIAKRHTAGVEVADAVAPLYVSRKLINTDDLQSWADSQGLPALNPDTHVTIVYSKTPVDWMSMPDCDTEQLIVPGGGPRAIDRFGPDDDCNTVVLRISHPHLHDRAAALLDAGCTSDFPDYKPHLTLFKDLTGAVDTSRIIPYNGQLIFSPEQFEPIKSDDDSTTPDDDGSETNEEDAAIHKQAHGPDSVNMGWVTRGVKVGALNGYGAGFNRKLSKKRDTGEYKEVHLPIRSLTSTQHTVHKDFANPVGGHNAHLPAVVKVGGEHYITDGHHRVAREAEKGAQHVKVRLYNMDEEHHDSDQLSLPHVASWANRDTGEIKPGTHVHARWREDMAHYPATYVKKNRDGSHRVTWHDGGHSENVDSVRVPRANSDSIHESLKSIGYRKIKAPFAGVAEAYNHSKPTGDLTHRHALNSVLQKHGYKAVDGVLPSWRHKTKPFISLHARAGSGHRLWVHSETERSADHHKIHEHRKHKLAIMLQHHRNRGFVLNEPVSERYISEIDANRGGVNNSGQSFHGDCCVPGSAGSPVASSGGVGSSTSDGGGVSGAAAGGGSATAVAEQAKAQLSTIQQHVSALKTYMTEDRGLARNHLALSHDGIAATDARRHFSSLGYTHHPMGIKPEKWFHPQHGTVSAIRPRGSNQNDNIHRFVSITLRNKSKGEHAGDDWRTEIVKRFRAGGRKLMRDQRRPVLIDPDRDPSVCKTFGLPLQQGTKIMPSADGMGMS